MISAINSNNYNQNFGNSDRTMLNKKQKAVIATTSVMGIAPVLGFLAKRKGFSLNPIKIIKTPIRDWAIFKYKPSSKSIEFDNPFVITAVASGSVAGGFVGGALVDDKSNLRAKKREVLSQILGNVIVPVTTVWAGSLAFDKVKDKLENSMFQFKSQKKVAQFTNKVLKAIPQGAATLVALFTGIYLGNRVSNLINEKLYHKKVERNIKATDFAPHVDDLCLATTIMNPTSDFGKKLGKVIPLALIVPGYQTGIAQEK